MSKFDYGQEIHGTVLVIGDMFTNEDEPLRFVTARLDDGREVEAYISGSVALSPGQRFQAKAGHTIYRPRGKIAGRETHLTELLNVTIELEAPKRASEPARTLGIFSRLFAWCSA